MPLLVRGRARSLALTTLGLAHLLVPMPPRPALLCYPGEVQPTFLSAAVRKGQGRLCAFPEHQLGPRQRLKPGTFPWPLVVTWIKDINTDPSCCRAMNPHVTLSSSMGWDFVMTSSGSGRLLLPPSCCVSSSSSLHRVQPTQLPFSPISPPHTFTL